MDSITHLSHKIMAERARQQQPTPPETEAPPPYSAEDDDSDDEDEDDDEPSMPIKLMINAAHSIQGSNNLVPTSPTPLADATRFSTLLLHAVNQINAANAAANGNAANIAQGKVRKSLKVDLTINCGITVIGDRNVIGNVGLKPRTAVAGPAPAAPAAVAGAKRKAEDEPEAEEASATKRIASSE